MLKKTKFLSFLMGAMLCTVSFPMCHAVNNNNRIVVTDRNGNRIVVTDPQEIALLNEVRNSDQEAQRNNQFLFSLIFRLQLRDARALSANINANLLEDVFYEVIRNGLTENIGLDGFDETDRELLRQADNYHRSTIEHERRRIDLNHRMSEFERRITQRLTELGNRNGNTQL